MGNEGAVMTMALAKASSKSPFLKREKKLLGECNGRERGEARLESPFYYPESQDIAADRREQLPTT